MASNRKRSTFQVQRAKVMQERRKKLQIAKYRPEEKSVCGRIAEFLNFCAQEDRYPHSIITYEEITQAIFSLGRLPDGRSKHVKSTRGQTCSAGRILMEKYKRSLITLRGVGARASVNDSDVLRESVTKDAERHRQTGEKLKKTVDLVSPERLKEQTDGLKGDPVLREEMLTLSEWLTNTVKKYVRSLENPKTAAALLPPPPAA